jgi:hypothetical protein
MPYIGIFFIVVAIYKNKCNGRQAMPGAGSRE